MWWSMTEPLILIKKGEDLAFDFESIHRALGFRCITGAEATPVLLRRDSV